MRLGRANYGGEVKVRSWVAAGKGGDGVGWWPAMAPAEFGWFRESQQRKKNKTNKNKIKTK